MGKKPWWKRALQFLRELLCQHEWRPLDGSFSNWRFCHKCAKTEALRWGQSIMVPVLKDWLIWNACQRAGHRETKHEASDRKDDGGPQGRG
jgi:hypothetical protein